MSWTHSGIKISKIGIIISCFRFKTDLWENLNFEIEVFYGIFEWNQNTVPKLFLLWRKLRKSIVTHKPFYREVQPNYHCTFFVFFILLLVIRIILCMLVIATRYAVLREDNMFISIIPSYMNMNSKTNYKVDHLKSFFKWTKVFYVLSLFLLYLGICISMQLNTFFWMITKFILIKQSSKYDANQSFTSVSVNI